MENIKRFLILQRKTIIVYHFVVFATIETLLTPTAKSFKTIAETQRKKSKSSEDVLDITPNKLGQNFS